MIAGPIVNAAPTVKKMLDGVLWYKSNRSVMEHTWLSRANLEALLVEAFIAGQNALRVATQAEAANKAKARRKA